MIGTGSILDAQARMKPVTCALDAPRHILVVDDEPLIRWSVAESLTDLGFDVEKAADAGAALRSVTTAVNPFDIVILDLRLPDMQDLSLLGTLRQLLPAATLILMTAFASPEIVADATAMGVAVINKPFEVDELERLIGAGLAPA
jgi:DNA-binding NtrC family response regulator